MRKKHTFRPGSGLIIHYLSKDEDLRDFRHSTIIASGTRISFFGSQQ